VDCLLRIQKFRVLRVFPIQNSNKNEKIKVSIKQATCGKKTLFRYEIPSKILRFAGSSDRFVFCNSKSDIELQRCLKAATTRFGQESRVFFCLENDQTWTLRSDFGPKRYFQADYTRFSPKSRLKISFKEIGSKSLQGFGSGKIRLGS
jgi:hypothetical protein